MGGSCRVRLSKEAVCFRRLRGLTSPTGGRLTVVVGMGARRARTPEAATAGVRPMVLWAEGLAGLLLTSVLSFRNALVKRLLGRWTGIA